MTWNVATAVPQKETINESSTHFGSLGFVYLFNEQMLVSLFEFDRFMEANFQLALIQSRCNFGLLDRLHFEFNSK